MTIPVAERIHLDVAELSERAASAERNFDAACRELRHVLDGLPYKRAKVGKYAKLRRRLNRFLSERLEGM